MLSCNIVRQLLPNYEDDLLDEKSRQEMDEHLEGCAECKAACGEMSVGLEASDALAEKADKKEIKYLAKRKKYMVIAVLVVAVVLTSTFLGVLKLFYWGWGVAKEDVLVNDYYESIWYGDELVDKKAVIEMTLKSGGRLEVEQEYVRNEEGKITQLILTPRQYLRGPFERVNSYFSYVHYFDARLEDYHESFFITVRYADG